jgi:hypothetical protein
MRFISFSSVSFASLALLALGCGSSSDAPPGILVPPIVSDGGMRGDDAGAAVGDGDDASSADATSANDAASHDAASRDGATPNGFRHPGVLLNGDQIAFVKAKVAAGTAPWKGAFDTAAASKYGSLTYAAAPVPNVGCGSYSNPDIGCTAEKSDAAAAYTHALLYALGGDVAHAQKSIEIMNAWSAVLTTHSLSNAPLQSGWVGAVFPRAAEIIRYTYSGWAPSDVARFATMLKTAYLPFLVNGARENGNWELSEIDGAIAIAVFTDDKPTFEKAVAMWRKRVPAYIYLSTDGAYPVPPPAGNATTPQQIIAFWYNQSTFMDGLAQETCRDLGHTQYGMAAIVNAAETARIQGVDLYSAEAKRITAGLEFHAKLLNGAPVPANLCGGTLNAVTPDPMWEIAFNGFANRLSLSLPETQTLLAKIRPTGEDHHMEWETLTHAEVGSVGIQ